METKNFIIQVFNRIIKKRGVRLKERRIFSVPEEG